MLALVPSDHLVAYTLCDSSLRDPASSFWSPWTPGMHVVHRHACGTQVCMQTNTQYIKAAGLDTLKDGASQASLKSDMG